MEHSNPILLKKSSQRAWTEDRKVEQEVSDFIGPAYRTEDEVNIMEDRGPWCVPGCVTIDSGAEGQYVQVRKIAEVHESSK